MYSFSSGRGQSVKAGIAANLLKNPSLLSMKGNRKGQSPVIQRPLIITKDSKNLLVRVLFSGFYNQPLLRVSVEGHWQALGPAVLIVISWILYPAMQLQDPPAQSTSHHGVPLLTQCLSYQ